MFLEERYEKIISDLNINGRVSVKELSRNFGVTEDCIRKDLKELESREKLKRVHGGAIPLRKHNDFKKLPERMLINREIKEKIALKASKLIKDGDNIFLDVSTINMEIAKIIKSSKKNVTVVTNMIDIISILGGCDNVKVICIGGEYNNKINGIAGSEADSNIRNYYYDKSFIGVCAVNSKTGFITSSLLEDGNTKKTIIECTNKTYLVMENEKFNYDEFYKFANLDLVAGIITEAEVSEEVKENLIDKDVNLL